VRRRLTALLASIVIASALAIGYAADPPAEVPGEGIRGRTLTCSANLELTVACFVEQTAFAVGPFEVAIGVDTRVAFRGATVDDQLEFGGYAILGWYQPDWGVWLEVHAPSLTPVIGTPDWLRVGFTVRF
jgi:hypothetical protein